MFQDENKPETPDEATPVEEARGPLGYGGRKPWNEYDKATVGEIMKRAVALDDAGRARIVEYEQRNKKRDAVMLPLVNWNS